MVRPIEIQQVIVQTNSIEKIQNIQQQQSSLQQSYIELQQKEEKKLAQETVLHSSKTEKAVIRDRESRKNRELLNQRQKKTEIPKDEMNDEEDIESEGKGRFINIKV